MRLGIDVGGTKIEAAALDEKGTIRARRRVATPKQYDEILGTLVMLTRAIEKEAGPVEAVGVGAPGALSPATGLMQNAENTALQGKPFDRDLVEVLGRPARVANDAACFALSEAIDGAGAGARVVFGVIVGTGTGGGVVIDGRPLGTCEWGHNPLPHATAEELAVPCSCGRLGCIEAFLAGPGFHRDGKDLDRYVDRMARALASVINVLDPDVIVLGGGLSAIDELYERVPAAWAPHVASHPVRARLVRNAHGDASGVRGAAWL